MTSSLRPLLVPGARLYRLSATSALVGAHPGKLIALKPGTFELLRLLNGARDLDHLQALLQREVPDFRGDVREILAPLIQCGAVLPHRPARFGLASPHISADGPAAPFASLLESALSPRRPTRAPVRASRQHPWHIIVSTGEPARLVFDQFLIDGISHVPVVLEAETVHIGPLTVPTLSPCLNCYDEHRNRTEPRWPALTAQFGTGHLECGVSLSTQYRAIAELLRIFETDGGDSLIGRRVSISPDSEPQATQFGFGSRCHCHLLAA